MSRQKNSILINKHALNREPVPLIIVDNVYIEGLVLSFVSQ